MRPKIINKTDICIQIFSQKISNIIEDNQTYRKQLSKSSNTRFFFNFREFLFALITLTLYESFMQAYKCMQDQYLRFRHIVRPSRALPSKFFAFLVFSHPLLLKDLPPVIAIIRLSSCFLR